MMSDRYDRVLTAIRRQEPDRVPWALWGHFPAIPFLNYYSWEKANRDGAELAKAHIALLNALDYKMDLLKVTPFYRFMAYQWGSKFRFTNNDELKRQRIGRNSGFLIQKKSYVNTFDQLRFFREK
jgi:hypothetical protein